MSTHQFCLDFSPLTSKTLKLKIVEDNENSRKKEKKRKVLDKELI